MPERRRVAINLSNDLEFRRNGFSVRQNMCSKASVTAAFRNLMSEMRRCGESFGAIGCGATWRIGDVAAIGLQNEMVTRHRHNSVMRVA
jgi:hypothetical protein